jgi:hypothetical protein
MEQVGFEPYQPSEARKQLEASPFDVVFVPIHGGPTATIEYQGRFVAMVREVRNDFNPWISSNLRGRTDKLIRRVLEKVQELIETGQYGVIALAGGPVPDEQDKK